MIQHLPRLVLSSCLALVLGACATNTGTAIDKKATQGAIVGTIVGAAAGAAADDHKRGRGALIGATVGALAGAGVGAYLDRQAEEMGTIEDADIDTFEDHYVVSLPGDVLFDSGSRSLAPGAFSRLDQVADTLARYPETEVLVKGHTDAEGGEEYNLRLSEDRAEAVRRYLIARGVHTSRITALGFGEAMPMVSNDTAAGRQQNRRVEIVVRPVDDGLGHRVRPVDDGGSVLADNYDG